MIIIKTLGDLQTLISPDLDADESITAVGLVVSPQGLSATYDHDAKNINLTLKGGQLDTDYLLSFLIVTNKKTISEAIPVGIEEPTFNPYDTIDPDAYQDLVGELEAGKSGLSTVIFQFGPDFATSGSHVEWDLLDSDGTIYASGQSFELKTKVNGLNTIVVAKSIVTAPANIPPTLDTPYQLRYAFKTDEITSYQFENIRIYGFVDIQVGSPDVVELVGDTANLSLVTEKLYQNYVVEIYQGGKLVSTTSVSAPQRISAGYFVATSVETSGMEESLIPYQVVWKFWTQSNQVFREMSKLWLINTDILQAVDDIKSKLNKARQTLYGTPDSQFPTNELLKWMRRGMDNFNGAYGIFTNFTMTHALGAIREFWLLCSEKSALESQLLLEGEKAFNFGGAAITLDVDKTGILDNMIGKIESQLANELKLLKQALTTKGILGGDGSGPNGNGDFSGSSRANIAAVGLLRSPVSAYSSYR
jgi:hypothetical protein